MSKEMTTEERLALVDLHMAHMRILLSHDREMTPDERNAFREHAMKVLDLTDEQVEVNGGDDQPELVEFAKQLRAELAQLTADDPETTVH